MGAGGAVGMWRNPSARANFRSMRVILAACIVVLVALPGRAVRYSTRERASGPGITTSQVSVASASPLGNAIIVGVMLADGVRYYRLGPDGKTSVRAPEPDPDR